MKYLKVFREVSTVRDFIYPEYQNPELHLQPYSHPHPQTANSYVVIAALLSQMAA